MPSGYSCNTQDGLYSLLSFSLDEIVANAGLVLVRLVTHYHQVKIFYRSRWRFSFTPLHSTEAGDALVTTGIVDMLRPLFLKR